MNRGGTLGPREIGENNGARTNEGEGGRAGAMKEVHDRMKNTDVFFFFFFFLFPFLFLFHGFLQREGRRITHQ